MGQKFQNGLKKKGTIFRYFWITQGSISQSMCIESNVREYLRSLYYKPINKKRQDVLKAMIRLIPNAADVNSLTSEKMVNPCLEVG